MVHFRSRHPVNEPPNPHEDADPNSFEQGQHTMAFPVHPLPSMQAPFEESMLDSTGTTGYVSFHPPTLSLERRQRRLCRDTEAAELDWNFSYNCHWRNLMKGKYHPLLKTIAQITFGIHLLHQHLQKSVSDVADILSKHVNELDSFLQRANEDIEGSLKDMLFRRKLLKVPMEHVNEFDRLLDDRLYRAQLLDGNITIERTITRMSVLLNDYLIDISTFRDANTELRDYLSHIGNAWTEENVDTGRIYSAMYNNTSGWAQFLQSLINKAEKLGVILVQVSSFCNEIEKRCGAASRRSLIASRSSSRTSNSRDTSRSWRNTVDSKPLPSLPDEKPFVSGFPSPCGGPLASPDDTSRIAQNKRPAKRTESNISTVIESDSSETLHQRQTFIVPVQTVSEPTHNYPDSGITQTARDSESEEPPADIPLSCPDQKGIQHRADDPKCSRIQDLRSSENGDTSETTRNRHRSAPNLPQRATGEEKKEQSSPLLTGKDSAYSSVSSGGSFASPTVTHPPTRSASSLSSHSRPQFALFPSSSPGTPKHPLKGRHGALSPVLASSSSSSLPKLPEEPHRLVQRSQSALDTHSSVPRRLLKKTSLSSIKRLFNKKRHAAVDPIVE
ncbi:hypothetical protein GQ43DRAFT_33496 [Delitschia confertaspora ATCC 74209]|uniref:Uncharacterized protein n=1 Tax=Delitschia confertaspora ATCC 74209 TaxID=1513339 RepID=A0A9P4JLY2_9PLEO|nr:hypothetical protein GQ43DRAFT_33496 [Delitschia confertaspora ATCC 74209]